MPTSKKIVAVGGGHRPKAAARARRLMPDKITVIEGSLVSYGSCGPPFLKVWSEEWKN